MGIPIPERDQHRDMGSARRMVPPNRVRRGRAEAEAREMMSAEQGVGGFFRHRALILVAAGGAVAEGGILTALAPAARPVAPQVTALPSIAAYHDLRWLFADGGSWAGFAAIMLAVLLARAALDAMLLLLAWPRTPSSPVPPPRPSRAFWSCLGLTAVSWVL